MKLLPSFKFAVMLSFLAHIMLLFPAITIIIVTGHLPSGNMADGFIFGSSLITLSACLAFIFHLVNEHQ